MDEAYIGSIAMFGFNFAPKGYLPCDGRQISISQNQALYALIGTSFGGNGTTYYNLPDLRGKTPIGMGQAPGGSNYTLGQTGGTETVSLLTTNLPPHSHGANGLSVTLHGSETNGNQTSPQNHVPAIVGVQSGRDFNTQNGYSDQSPNVALASSTITVGGHTDITGSGLPVQNMQPYVVINFAMCVEGLFPLRP